MQRGRFGVWPRLIKYIILQNTYSRKRFSFFLYGKILVCDWSKRITWFRQKWGYPRKFPCDIFQLSKFEFPSTFARCVCYFEKLNRTERLDDTRKCLWALRKIRLHFIWENIWKRLRTRPRTGFKNMHELYFFGVDLLLKCQFASNVIVRKLSKLSVSRNVQIIPHPSLFSCLLKIIEELKSYYWIFTDSERLALTFEVSTTQFCAMAERVGNSSANLFMKVGQSLWLDLTTALFWQ